MTTRERIRRDRELHRLGLGSVERIPRDCLVDLVQDLCIALETPDATGLPSAVRRLLHVIAAVPRLERFVGEVCEVRSRSGWRMGWGGGVGGALGEKQFVALEQKRQSKAVRRENG